MFAMVVQPSFDSIDPPETFQRAAGLPASQFEGYKPCQKRCRIKLANYSFDIAKTTRHRMDRYDIAIAVVVRVTKLR